MSARMLLPTPPLFLTRRLPKVKPELDCITPAPAPVPTCVRPPRRAGFQTTGRRRRPEPQTQRYGTANEPPAHLGGGKLIPRSPPKSQDGERNRALVQPSGDEERLAKAPVIEEAKSGRRAFKAKEGQSREQKDKETIEHPDTSSKPLLDPNRPSSSSTSPSDTLSSILSAESAMSSKRPDSTTQSPAEDPAMAPSTSDRIPPHLEPPPYIHHFDTYTLVKSLQSPPNTSPTDPSFAFTSEQAITVMKGIRAILSDNWSLARDGLLSKSDSEMEAHQFRATAAELRTEVKQRRSAATERMRAERTQLQHEVDLVGQRVTQESLGLKDEVKGMFDDRRMETRMNRRKVENAIQELNYKIAVALNSEMRNEVEGLRFILTRRTVLALAGVFLTGLWTLRYVAYSRGEHEKVVKKMEVGAAVGDSESGGGERGVQERGGVDLSSSEISKRIERGDSPALVSLG